MKNKIERFFLWRWLLRIERLAMMFSSVVVVLTVVSSVVCRYILKINFAGSDEILILYALWLYFIGGLYGNYEDCHIKADVLSMFVRSPALLHLFDILAKTISLAVSLALAVWACQYLSFCLKMGGYTTVFHIPMLCSRGALVVGYIAPVLYNAYHLILVLFGREESGGGAASSTEGGDAL